MFFRWKRERGGLVASPTRARKRATKRCSRSVGIELILPKTQENRCWRRAWGSGRTQREETTVRRSDLIFPRGANQMGNRRKRRAFGWRWQRRCRRRIHESVMRRRTNFGRASVVRAARQRLQRLPPFQTCDRNIALATELPRSPTIQCADETDIQIQASRARGGEGGGWRAPRRAGSCHNTASGLQTEGVERGRREGETGKGDDCACNKAATDMKGEHHFRSANLK